MGHEWNTIPCSLFKLVSFFRNVHLRLIHAVACPGDSFLFITGKNFTICHIVVFFFNFYVFLIKRESGGGADRVKEEERESKAGSAPSAQIFMGVLTQEPGDSDLS